MPAVCDLRKALVLFSGGQDSTVALAWALERFDSVETIGFDYGQRHGIELTQRLCVREGLAALKPEWRARLGADHVVRLGEFGATPSALTSTQPIEVPEYGLPTSFVPGRNLVFFLHAAIAAYASGVKHLIGGMCETDYSGYPDCRDDTLKAMQIALNLGMGTHFIIETPLMLLTKKQTWQLAQSLGGEQFIALIVEDTHTCYLGERGRRYDWGYGCGTCPACELRARGFAAWRADA